MISEEKISVIIDVFKPYSPDMIGIFGSFARNENTTGSDLDILYRTLTLSISLFDYLNILHSLEYKLNVKVDLLSEKAMHPNLKDLILKDLKVIYAC